MAYILLFHKKQRGIPGALRGLNKPSVKDLLDFKDNWSLFNVVLLLSLGAEMAAILKSEMMRSTLEEPKDVRPGREEISIFVKKSESFSVIGRREIGIESGQRHT